jgi:hypothetical protein
VRSLATTTTTGGETSQKKKLVVLGNGWAGYRLILDVDITKYDLSVISPRYTLTRPRLAPRTALHVWRALTSQIAALLHARRNYFLFTPLLTSTTGAPSSSLTDRAEREQLNSSLFCVYLLSSHCQWARSSSEE